MRVLILILFAAAAAVPIAVSAVRARFSVSVSQSGALIRLRISALFSLVRIKRVLLIRFAGSGAFRPMRLTKAGFVPLKKRSKTHKPGLALIRRILAACRIISLRAGGGLFLEDAAAAVCAAGAVNTLLRAASDIALIAGFPGSAPEREFSVRPLFGGGATLIALSGIIEAKTGRLIKEAAAGLLRRGPERKAR